MDWHWMDGWGWTMMAFVLVFWLALLGLAFWGISEWSRHARRGRPAETAQEILDRSLAQGEIDPEGYRQAREALEGKHERAVG